MVRLPIALLLLLASACESKPSSQPAATPPAESTAPTPVAPAGRPPASDAAPAPADAAPAADDTAVGAAAPIAPESLAGQYAFGWSRGKTARCKKLDARMMKQLAGDEVMCRHRDPGAAFAEGAGVWSTCQVGESEWVIFATKAICQEQLETMEANAP